MSLTAYMKEVQKKFNETNGELPKVWDENRLIIQNYEDCQQATFIMREMATQMAFSFNHRLFHYIRYHALFMLTIEIQNKNWIEAAKWLRPGIPFIGDVYGAYESNFSERLGPAARAGRADLLRMAFWKLKNLYHSKDIFYSNPEIKFNTMISTMKYLMYICPIEKTDLSDAFYPDEGTPYEVWQKCIQPFLIEIQEQYPPLYIILKEYDEKLCTMSPLLPEQSLVMAQGLHPRLGLNSPFYLLTPELLQEISSK